MTSCNSLYLALLVVNWLKEARRDNFGIIVGSLGHPKPSNFIERVIIFKHFVVFASSASVDQQTHPKSYPRDAQNLQKNTASRTPGAPWSVLEASKETPKPFSERSKVKPLGVILEVSGPHFRELQGLSRSSESIVLFR